MLEHFRYRANFRAAGKTTVAPPADFRAATTTSTSKIRLGFLSPNLNAGGAEQVQLTLLKNLDPTKFSIIGMVVGDAMSITDANMTALTSAYVPIQYGLANVAALASSCDVLISWMVEDYSKWLGTAKTPIIFIDHFPNSAPKNSITQYCLSSVAAVVGVSSLCSPAWTAPAWASKYRVIPNAVDTTRLAVTQTKAQMLAAWGIKANALGVYPPIAGSYCRLHLDRRPDAVIRAMPSLPSTYHVVVIGEQQNASEVAYINSLIAAMSSDQQSRTHLLPENMSSGNVLSAMDVIVSAPSGATESFGLTACEATWVGKPVLATPYGLASLYPQYFYPIALDDTAPNIANQIVLAHAFGAKSGAQAFVQQTYSIASFVSAWTTLINSLAPVKAQAVAATIRDRVQGCCGSITHTSRPNSD